MNKQTAPEFNGPDYQPELDFKRLTGQMESIRNLMLDARWRTLREIADATGYGEASISAQLRHLTKPRFGSHTKEKRRRGDGQAGLFEYRITKPEDA